MPISSSLSEINAVLTSTYYGVLKSVDQRWVRPGQVVYSVDNSWETVKESYFKSNQSADLVLPFAALVRDPQVYAVDQMGGYRSWDGDWIDSNASVSSRTVSDVVVRGVTLQYELNIYDSRMETSESLIQSLILSGNPKNQRVDFTSDILQCASCISYVGDIPRYKKLPSSEDRRRGTGYLYQVGMPIKVNGVIGNLNKASRILEVQASIYARMQSTTVPVNPENEGDHVLVAWDSTNNKFTYTWTGDV